MIIRDYKIGALLALSKSGKCSFVGSGGKNGVSPSAKQSARSLQHNWSVGNNKNYLAFDRKGCRGLDGLGGRDAFIGHRNQDCESRTSAHSRNQVDLMVEKYAKPVDNSQAEPEAAAPVLFWGRKLKKLAKDIPLLILRNAGTAIPYFDTQHFTALATSDDDPAPQCIAHSVGYQIEQYAFEQHGVAPHPGVTSPNA